MPQTQAKTSDSKPPQPTQNHNYGSPLAPEDESTPLWERKAFKAILDDDGNITPDGHKLVIENQRKINGKIFVALKAIFDASKKLAESRAADYVEAIPGDEPPGCSEPW